ncbi:hypothetical protein LIA77_07183 [Sarocladium implicatum]|nr:hypothetical protein LIA77_07183 [Sarocladium implicatum]
MAACAVGLAKRISDCRSWEYPHNPTHNERYLGDDSHDAHETSSVGTDLVIWVPATLAKRDICCSGKRHCHLQQLPTVRHLSVAVPLLPQVALYNLVFGKQKVLTMIIELYLLEQ